MDDEFMSILKQNNSEIIRNWINMEGKKPKPISPIYFFLDLTRDEMKRVKNPIYKL